MDISAHVDKAVDQAAGVAKKKIGELVPGGKKHVAEKGEHAAADAKGVDEKIAGGIEKAVGDAENQAASFGKKLFK